MKNAMKTKKCLVLFCLLAASMGVAEAKVLYYDNFEGSAGIDLNGRAPDISAFGGGETWVGNDRWKADGSVGDGRVSATLPFTPEVGKVYQVTVPFESMLVGAGSENWMGMGFAVGSSTASNNSSRFISGDVQGNPWIIKAQSQPGGNTYGGPAAAAAASYAGAWNDAVEMRVILDTRPAIWKAIWQIRNLTTAAFATLRQDDWPANPTITTVGMVNNNCLGQVGSFLLEDVLGDSDPNPTYGQTNVEVDTTKLTWNASSNENLTGYYLYMVAGEPNFEGAVPMLIARTAGLVEVDVPIVLEKDRAYYWRVEEQINSSPAGDSNNVVGPVWYFDTQKTLPVVVTQPVVQFVRIGETATFNVEVASPTATTNQWYYSADNVATPELDTPVGGDAAVLDVSGEVAAEGYYYCKVTNADGEAVSDVVGLVIKRLVARYKFEQSANDSSPWPPGFDGTWVGTESYAAGSVGNYAADLTGSSHVDINSGSHPFDPDSIDPRYATISWWYQATSPSSDAMAVLGAADTGGNNNVQLALNDGEGAGAGSVRLYLRSASDAPTPGSLSFSINPQTVDLLDGDWHHVAVTWDIGPRGIGTKFYIDGQLESYYPVRLDLVFNPWEFDLYVGARNNRGTAAWPMVGLLDDVRIYNYAVDVSEILEPSSTGFLITEIVYDSETPMVTLTWTSEPGDSYAIKFSEDMTDWNADIDDSVPADVGETTTKTFSIPGPLAAGGKVYFRVETR